MSGTPRAILSATLILLVCSAPTYGDESDDLLERVRNEYPAAVKRLETAYSRVRGSGRSETRIPLLTAPGERTIVADFSFAFDGDRKRVVESIVDATPQKTRVGHRAHCMNGEHAFWLSRETSDTPYLLNGHGNAEDGYNAVADDEIMEAVGSSLSAASNLYGMPMSWILESPRFRFTKATAAPEEDREFIELEFENPEPNPGPRGISGVYAGTIVVDPASAWRIQRAVIFFDQSLKRPFHIEVEYGPSVDGSPVPRRLTVLEPRPMTREWRFDDIEFAGAPESEFTLTAFGLPEISQHSADDQTGTPFRAWIVVAGALGLLVAIVLYRLAQSAEKRASLRTARGM